MSNYGYKNKFLLRHLLFYPDSDDYKQLSNH